MKLLVNGSDYTACLAAEPALKVERTLNKPSTCTFALADGQSGLATPLRDQFVEVTADNGTVLFTGYVYTDAFDAYAGEGIAGPSYLTHVGAISEEYVLDRQVVPTFGGGANQGAGDMLGAITSRLDARGLNTSALHGGPTIGRYVPEVGKAWSHHAAALASQSRQSYRVLNGAASMVVVGSTNHDLDSSTVSLGALSFDCARPLANDVTLTGEGEGNAFVTEIFQGDGTTKEFDLSHSPWKPAKGALINEGFNESGINNQVWQLSDPGSHLALGPTGLTISGGNGTDGQTMLCAIDPVEVGGALVLEAGNVQFAAGSDGQVCGLYAGMVSLASCVAGFRIRSSSGALLLVPVMDGSEVATPFTLTPNHGYTLRIRLTMPEVTRVLATYYSSGAGGVLARGGGLVASCASVEFELQDSAAAANTPATVLFDGSLPVTPATATFCAANSVALTGSIGYVTATRTGTVRVSSIPSGGVERTRRIGTAAQGAECHISGEKLEFYTAATPASGELIKVRYRTERRSVARLATGTGNAVAVGVPPVAQWTASVSKPVARCSADCEAAAQAVLDFSTSALAAWKGTVTGTNLQQLPSGDVWPGDSVTLTGPLLHGANAAQPGVLLVRSAAITATSAMDEVLVYKLALANDWSEAVSVAVKGTVAQDAVLPPNPAPTVRAVSPDIAAADVTAVTTTSLTLAMNATAPAGGGFEVRRQDANFGDGVTAGISPVGLVLRSPVANFSLARSADHEEFYIRMFDGSTPPQYSRVSAAIITNVPSQ